MSETGIVSSNKKKQNMTNPIDLNDPDLYLNRELSLLAFNQRVLSLATRSSVPLLERLQYLFICNRNLDEFFEVRVAGLKQQVDFAPSQRGVDGKTAEETLKEVCEIIHELSTLQGEVFNNQLLPALAKEEIKFLEQKDWNEEIRQWTKKFFRTECLPVLTPIGLDLAHPFPRLVNKSLNFIVTLDGRDAFGRESGLAIIHVPRILPRVVRIPSNLNGRGDSFIFLSSLIQSYAADLFPGMDVTGCYQFRLTRNSELYVDEERVDDLMQALQGKLASRRYGDIVRLEVGHDCPEKIVEFLVHKFELTEQDIYKMTCPVNLNRLSMVLGELDRPDLRFAPYQAGLPKSIQTKDNMFALLKKQDLLLYHPYQSFTPVEEFIRQAANDQDVLAIKVTLYRTKTRSQLLTSLIEAARSGKEVTAVIELRARFDEEDNIALANQLQEAGALVVYGVVGHKTHAKMTLIVRRENGKIVRYAHLGTGNYHSINAQQYADFSLFSRDKSLCTDVHAVFQQLTGMGRASKLKKILHAPFTLHKSLLNLIDREIEHAQAGRSAQIIMKMNSLTEPKIIQALYRASMANVKVEIIVRGICCLKPGVPGVSDNIRVRSLVGRFLEHARIYYFHNDGESDIFLSSADCMERNLYSRVEICFPVEDKKLAERVKKEGLMMQLADKGQSWLLQRDGSYKFIGEEHDIDASVQAHLIQLLADFE